jgi:hypothetical protein
MARLIGHILVLIIVSLGSNCLHAQYDGLEKSHSVSKKNNFTKRLDTSINEFGDTIIQEVFEGGPKSFSSNFSKFNGIETFFSPIIVSELYLDIGPFWGTYFKNNLLLAAGPQATTLLSFNNKSSLSGGAFAFARVNIGRVFLQPEYRITNIFEPTANQRQWIGSPVILGGILSNGKSQWASVGFIVNGKLANASPFGAFVFRFGFEFN